MFEDQDGYDAYQFAATQAKAASVDPHQLVLMLMDGLLDEMARAEGHILAKQFERKGQAINKCLQILGDWTVRWTWRKAGSLLSTCIVSMTIVVSACLKSAYRTMWPGSLKCVVSCWS